jgi:putative sigma-54 modulation protein
MATGDNPSCLDRDGGVRSTDILQGGIMRIDIRGRNVEITDELRGHVVKRFRRVGRQVSELATLDVEISEERNPSIADRHVAEATLYLKGVTLRAREASPEMAHTIHELAEDIRRQVKRHRELRRKRTQTRRAVNRMRGRIA